MCSARGVGTSPLPNSRLAWPLCYWSHGQALDGALLLAGSHEGCRFLV